MASRNFVLIALVLSAFVMLHVQPVAAAQSARTVLNIDYNLDSEGPGQAGANALDLYIPEIADGTETNLRPVVVWVHGGGFMIGDKTNRMADKVRLFNGMGFIVASLNYRLSPDISGSDTSQAFAAGRVRAPDHISDVAEAFGWIDRNIQAYGGDPDRLIPIGHSAGAHLVSLLSVSPSWVNSRGVSQQQILGTVMLDTNILRVRDEADPNSPGVTPSRRALIQHTFGTPDEEAADPRWDLVSPLLHADPSDPPVLLVTQANVPVRMASNSEMATALGQDPATSVVGVPYNHEGINTSLGSAADPSGETTRVSQFMQGLVDDWLPASVRITKRPAKLVRVGRHTRTGKPRMRKARFAWSLGGNNAGAQCRIDARPYRSCESPRLVWLRAGKHTFRVRPLYPSGRPGEERKVSFRIAARRRR